MVERLSFHPAEESSMVQQSDKGAEGWKEGIRKNLNLEIWFVPSVRKVVNQRFVAKQETVAI
jgi:hypothetical protein